MKLHKSIFVVLAGLILLLTQTTPSVAAVCGDINNDGTVNIADLVYLVDYMFQSGPPPPQMYTADVNGDGGAYPDIADLVYLVEYMFQSGPPPICPTGTVVIDLSPDALNAPWSLTGPDSYSASGTGDMTLTELTPGDYTIIWGTVPGWITFSNSTQTLAANGILTFNGTYLETSTVTDIDGNVYQTVTIGTQEWMMENLKVTHYRNGDAIPNVTDNTAWYNLTTGAYCDYNNDVNNVATYGRLYNWYAVVDWRNIAPEGWHVPSDAEWQTLVDYLGVSSVAGGKMKEAGTTHWADPNTGATNESGFTALPGGYRLLNGTFYSLGYSAYFLSSTELSSVDAWSRSLYYNNSESYRFFVSKRNGLSVRCVRD